MIFLRYLASRFLHSLCAAVDCSLYDWPERLSDYEAEREVIEAQTEIERDSVFRSGGQLKEYGPRPRIATARPTSPAPMSDGQAVSGVEVNPAGVGDPPEAAPAGPPTSPEPVHVTAPQYQHLLSPYPTGFIGTLPGQLTDADVRRIVREELGK